MAKKTDNDNAMADMIADMIASAMTAQDSRPAVDPVAAPVAVDTEAWSADDAVDYGPTLISETFQFPVLTDAEIEALPGTGPNGDGSFHKFSAGFQQIRIDLPNGQQLRGNINCWIVSSREQAFKSGVLAKLPKDPKTGQRPKLNVKAFVEGRHVGMKGADGVTRLPAGKAKGAK